MSSQGSPVRKGREEIADLTVVIPAFNEAKRIPVTLSSVANYLAAVTLNTEVIVVDDGSSDDTVAVVEAMTRRFEDLSVVRSGRNFGKGHAVRLGMAAAVGRWRLFMDADNSFDISELDVLQSAAKRVPGGVDVVVGSGGAGRTVRSLRGLLGSAGGEFIRRMVPTGVHDSQRGFKLFSAEAAEDIFPRLRVDRWAFDVEVLGVASKLGYRILEVPVKWEHCDGSKVTATAYAQSLVEVFKVRRSLSTGEYLNTDNRVGL